MKNSKRGFVLPAVLIICALLGIAVGVKQYYTSSHTAEVSEVKNVESWNGTYAYEEFLPPNINMRLSLDVTDASLAQVAIDGYMMLRRLNATTQEQNGTLTVIFDSYQTDDIRYREDFIKGDVLFVVSRDGEKYVTTWGKIQGLDQNKKIGELKKSDGMAGWKTYENREYGLEMKYQNTWSPVSDISLSTIQINDVKLALQHQSGCFLVFADIDTRYIDDGRFSNKFNADTKTFWETSSFQTFIGDKSYVVKEYWRRPQGGNGSQYSSKFEYVATLLDNFPNNRRPYSILLYADDRPIQESCLSDFQEILMNGVHIPTYTVAASSNGILNVDSGFYVLNATQSNRSHWDKTKSALVFKDNSGEERIVTYLEGNQPSSGQYLLLGDMLYYIAKGSKSINALDMYSKQNIVLVNDVSEDQITTEKKSNSVYDNKTIQDFYIIGDDVFYLWGTCNEKGGCKNVLKKFNLKNGVTSIMAGDIVAPTFYGHNSSYLYFEQFAYECFGDHPSCITFYSYNFQNNKVETLKNDPTSNLSTIVQTNDSIGVVDGTFHGLNTEENTVTRIRTLNIK